jgi:mycothiol synthase
MSSSLPDGYSLRPGCSTDVQPLTDLIVAEERAVRGESQWGAVDTADWLRNLEDRGEAWIATGSDGRLAAVLGLSQRDDHFEAWIALDPADFGRGLGPALVERAETRTKVRGGTRLHLDTFGENTAAKDLFESKGYAEERRHYLMQIDLRAPPEEASAPPGITVTTFDRDGDAHDFHSVMNDAFAGQWGFRPMPFEDWERLRLEAPDFDSGIWFVARAGDEVAGVLRGDPNRWGCGWIGMVAVRPRWQRCGVGTALIRRSFAVFYDRGTRCVGLGVDAENPTNATRLYERLGMRVKAETITYGRVLG